MKFSPRIVWQMHLEYRLGLSSLASARSNLALVSVEISCRLIHVCCDLLAPTSIITNLSIASRKTMLVTTHMVVDNVHVSHNTHGCWQCTCLTWVFSGCWQYYYILVLYLPHGFYFLKVNLNNLTLSKVSHNSFINMKSLL